MSDALRLYSVSDRYIRFLRADQRLYGVYSGKEDTREHTRKYLGVVIHTSGFNYFIPLSSGRDTDYFVDKDGQRQIRKSVLPIIRMVSNATRSKERELLGTLRISNMIPVPDSELTAYDISSECDRMYKSLILKEYAYIKANSSLIRNHANALYNQKTKEASLFSGEPKPGYLNSTLDFRYAEKKCLEFCDTECTLTHGQS